MTARVACTLVLAAALGCSSPSRAPVDGSDQSYDAEALKGEFGEACAKHTDCTLGFCIEPIGNTGGVCTRTCKNDCPEGWECHNVHLPQVDLDLCVPAAQQLCLACASDAECGGGTCLQIDGAGRCATACSGQCPVGYTCTADATGTHPGSYCQPVTASCSCSQALSGASRSCSNSNGAGTCFGSQTCNPATGWSPCTATVPAAESCDGKDNDCNFIIDDGVGGGTACTNTVAGVGSCPGVRACDGSSGFVCIGQTPMQESCNYVDDNCNGTSDETYKSGAMALGTTCSAGVGACLRYGSYVCNAMGTGTQCSAVAGASGNEMCNQIDDNCNGTVDEPYKTGAMALGAQCSSGNGICARYGSFVCKPDGTGTQCSATPANVATGETCNYLDDNCDGVVDNGYRNTTTGFYDTDQNCGSCGNNCTTQFTAQNSYGACQVGTSPQCVMRCNAGTGNLNNSTVDGCEFVIDATAIYVSTTDTTAVDDATCGIGPSGTGTGNHPCKTITYGLTRAGSTSRANVLVADGTYNEGVVLVGGKNVLGGYRADTWERHVSTTNTVIAGSTTVNGHDRGVSAISITTATVFEGFVVRGSFNSKPGGNSYAIYIATSNASLVIKNNQIIGGRGGAGVSGMPGFNGTTGIGGGGTADPNSATYAATAVSTCSGNPSPFVVRQYSNGGKLTCGGDVVDGGAGGGNWCPPSWGDNIVPKQATEKSAIDGSNGQPGAGAGGGAAGAGQDAGDDGFIYMDASRCIIPSAPTFGVDGTAGTSGSSASGVGGCTNSTGMVSSGDWGGGSGGSGNPGQNGGGGGGGGAGGGAYCYDCNSNPVMSGGNHRIGGHGGGGGSGGCGGAGGLGGGSGGGVFGIFITGGSAPTITNNTITRGSGGDGGVGGIGGAGGLGGIGGPGGGSALFCTDKAGRGGDGGDGGAGAGGGGGCGGSSFGIFTSGVGTPTYCASNTVSGGSFGTGGAGGYSGGATGGSGVAGTLAGCTSI